MTGRGRTRLLVAAAVMGALVAAAPAAAQDAGPCEGDGGVTVVVDATALGGELTVRCAAGPQDNGFAALAGAGFAVETVAATPGLLCRIDGLPTPEAERCAADPPIDAYWAYWVGTPDGWGYATEGAATRRPPPGSVEGWSFVSGSEAVPPGAAPAELGAVATGPPPTDAPEGAPAAFPWATAVGLGVVAAFAATGYRHARRRGREIGDEL